MPTTSPSGRKINDPLSLLCGPHLLLLRLDRLRDHPAHRDPRHDPLRSEMLCLLRGGNDRRELGDVGGQTLSCRSLARGLAPGCRRPNPATRLRAPHSGMLPCFLGGFLSRFPSSISRASISFLRVSRGRMTASTYPRSAAT